MGAFGCRTISRRTKLRALRQMMAISPMILGACSTVGTTSIDGGRTPYNQVIHNTSEQQTLLNIIRVYHNETPFFMDVSEVDASTTVGASISGGPSQLGAIPNYKSTSAGTIDGAIGFITGGATYVESPTVRYLPLVGQPLIAQVSTPLTPDALTELFNSNWSLPAVLSLGIDRLTPGYTEYAPALNAIIELNEYGAIIIAGTQTPKKKEELNANALTITYNQQPAKNDSLSIYYEPAHIDRTRAFCDGSDENHATDITNALWIRLKKFYEPSFSEKELFDKKDPNRYIITLRSTGKLGEPVRPGTAQLGEPAEPPLLRTRSALGIMKVATEGGLVEIYDDLNQIQQLIDRLKIRQDKHLVLNRNPKIYFQCYDGFYSQSPQSIDPRHLVTLFPTATSLSLDQINQEIKLLGVRRFMLIGRSASPPNGAFVSVYDNGSYYYILDKDEISKKTLALIAQFNTILAAPGQAPLTPTISVGARM